MEGARSGRLKQMCRGVEVSMTRGPRVLVKPCTPSTLEVEAAGPEFRVILS